MASSRSGRGRIGHSQELRGTADIDLWYRAHRRGDTVTTLAPIDREQWTPLDQRRVDATDLVEVGLVACSHVPQTLVTATIADVNVGKLPDA